MIWTLNNKQKHFLVDNEYVTRKSVDSLNTINWEDYYIDNFEWKLDLSYNRYYMNDLILINKDTNEEDFRIMLNFQVNDTDLTTLMNL